MKLGRTWAILLAVVLAGCDGEGSMRGDADAVDDEMAEPEVRTDPRPEPASEPVEEAASDPYADPSIEPECESATGGMCNLIERCGCLPGFDCILFSDSSTCSIIEACDIESGTEGVDAECTLEEQCGLDLTCRFLGGDPWGRCMEWCLEDSDCSIAGRTCSEPTTFQLSEPCRGGDDVPFGLCSQTCPVAEDCNLFAADGEPTGCPDGEMCVRHAPLSQGGCDVSWCIRTGSGYPGDVCGMSTGDCSPGYGCYGSPGWTYRCRKYCTTDGAHPCDTVSCTALGSESWPELGVCGY